MSLIKLSDGTIEYINDKFDLIYLITEKLGSDLTECVEQYINKSEYYRYNQLLTGFEELEDIHNDLLSDYSTLNKNYENVLNKYNKLKKQKEKA